MKKFITLFAALLITITTFAASKGLIIKHKGKFYKVLSEDSQGVILESKDKVFYLDFSTNKVNEIK